jgi:hypothetical protein
MSDALGTDFACADDITADWALAASPRHAFLQALYRRLVLSGLFYADDYGLGIEGYLLDHASDADIRAAITTELLHDERVRDVRISGSLAALTIAVTPHDDPEFPLTLTIDRVTAALLTTGVA